MAEDPQEEGIGLAFSGGGFRAAAFSLGILLYLRDTNQTDNVRCISSVSGGSITNAYAAELLLRRDDPLDRENFWLRATPLLQMITRRRLLSAWWLLQPAAYVLMAVWYVPLLIGLTTSWRWGVISAAVIGLLAIYFGYMSLRSTAAQALAREIDRARPYYKHQRGVMRFFKSYVAMLKGETERMQSLMRGYRICTLGDLDATYSPILCTTDLSSGTHFYLSDSFVAGVSPRQSFESTVVNLIGTPNEMQLQEAVMASAAFPLVFQPVRVVSSRLGLPRREGRVGPRLRLADGGLFDNLGFAFFKTWADDRLDPTVVESLPTEPSRYILVNSGLPEYATSRRLGPIKAFRRSVDVVHQANGLARREQAESFLQHNSGVIISIGDNPYRVASEATDQVAAAPVRAMLERLAAGNRSMDRAWWTAVTQEWNPSVKTNLKGLGVDDATRLVMHGYVIAAAKCAIRFGWDPPSELPTLELLCDLATGQPPKRAAQ